MDENADPYEFFGIPEQEYDYDYDYDEVVGFYRLYDLEKSYSKVEVKKTPTAPKQYEFGFEFILKGEKCSTTYSPKNQLLLSKAWKDGHHCFSILHEVQKGPKKGTTVLHLVDFNFKKVMTTNGITHSLLMTDKTPKKVDSTPVVPSDPFKKIDWRLKMLSRKPESSDLGLSDCSSILCDDLSEWELAEWEEYLDD